MVNVTCVLVWPQLVEERERLSTEVAKQKYRVQHHILPYVEELRAEIAQLKAAGKSDVSSMSSGVEEAQSGRSMTADAMSGLATCKSVHAGAHA